MIHMKEEVKIFHGIFHDNDNFSYSVCLYNSICKICWVFFLNLSITLRILVTVTAASVNKISPN